MSQMSQQQRPDSSNPQPPAQPGSSAASAQGAAKNAKEKAQQKIAKMRADERQRQGLGFTSFSTYSTKGGAAEKPKSTEVSSFTLFENGADIELAPEKESGKVVSQTVSGMDRSVSSPFWRTLGGWSDMVEKYRDRIWAVTMGGVTAAGAAWAIGAHLNLGSLQQYSIAGGVVLLGAGILTTLSGAVCGLFIENRRLAAKPVIVQKPKDPAAGPRN